MKHAIQHLTEGKHLAEAVDMMRQIMEGRATDAQIAALAVALRMKGKTIEEITDLRGSCANMPPIFNK